MNWKQFTSHSLTLTLAFALPKLAKLIIYVLGARWLVQAGFGLFSYLHVMIEIFQHIFGGGMDNIAARYYSKDDDWIKFWQGGILGRILICCTGAIVGLFFFDFPYNFMFAGWFVLLMTGRIFYAYANTLLITRWIIAASGISSIVLVVGAVIGMKTAGVAGLVFAFLLERLTELVILLTGVLRRQPTLLSLRNWEDIPQKALDIIKLSLPLWFMQGLYILYSRLDAVLVKQMLGYEDLARYAITYRVSEAVLLVFSAIADSSLAFFFRYPDKIKNTYDKVGKNIVIIGLLGVIALHIFAYYGVELLWGAKYHGVKPLIAAYSWAILIMGLNMLNSNYVLAKGREKAYPRIGAIVLGSNLGANLILIPIIGPLAACWVTVGSGGINYILLRRAVGENRLKDWAITGGVLVLSILSAGIFS